MERTGCPFGCWKVSRSPRIERASWDPGKEVRRVEEWRYHSPLYLAPANPPSCGSLAQAAPLPAVPLPRKASVVCQTTVPSRWTSESLCIGSRPQKSITSCGYSVCLTSDSPSPGHWPAGLASHGLPRALGLGDVSFVILAYLLIGVSAGDFYTRKLGVSRFPMPPPWKAQAWGNLGLGRSFDMRPWMLS